MNFHNLEKQKYKILFQKRIEFLKLHVFLIISKYLKVLLQVKESYRQLVVGLKQIL